MDRPKISYRRCGSRGAALCAHPYALAWVMVAACSVSTATAIEIDLEGLAAWQGRNVVQ